MNIYFRCLESRIDKDNTLYGKFHFTSIPSGQGNTFANALRRSLFSDLSGLAITHFCITSNPGLGYEFATIPGLAESVLDFSLNLKKVVLTGRLTGALSTCYKMDKDISSHSSEEQNILLGKTSGYLSQAPKDPEIIKTDTPSASNLNYPLLYGSYSEGVSRYSSLPYFRYPKAFTGRVTNPPSLPVSLAEVTDTPLPVLPFLGFPCLRFASLRFASPKAIKDDQRRSKAIKGDQKRSRAITGTVRTHVPLRFQQRPSCTGKKGTVTPEPKVSLHRKVHSLNHTTGGPGESQCVLPPVHLINPGESKGTGKKRGFNKVKGGHPQEGSPVSLKEIFARKDRVQRIFGRHFYPFAFAFAFLPTVSKGDSDSGSGRGRDSDTLWGKGIDVQENKANLKENVIPKGSFGEGGCLPFKESQRYNVQNVPPLAPIGFLKAKGPAVLRACDLLLPPGIRCVHPDQYLGTLAADSALSIKFLIASGKGYIVQDETFYKSLSRAKLLLASRSSKNPIFSTSCAPYPVKGKLAFLPSLKFLPADRVKVAKQGKKTKSSLHLFHKRKANNYRYKCIGNIDNPYPSLQRRPYTEGKGIAFSYASSFCFGFAKPPVSKHVTEPLLSLDKKTKLLVRAKPRTNQDLIVKNSSVQCIDSAFRGTLPQKKINQEQSLAKLNDNEKLSKKQLIWDAQDKLHPVLPLDATFTPITKVNFQIDIDRNKERSEETIVFEIWTNGSITPKRAIQESCLALAQDFYNLFCSVNGLSNLHSWWKRESAQFFPRHLS